MKDLWLQRPSFVLTKLSCLTKYHNPESRYGRKYCSKRRYVKAKDTKSYSVVPVQLRVPVFVFWTVNFFKNLFLCLRCDIRHICRRLSSIWLVNISMYMYTRILISNFCLFREFMSTPTNSLNINFRHVTSSFTVCYDQVMIFGYNITMTALYGNFNQTINVFSTFFFSMKVKQFSIV